jgi:hypothetical protein
LYYLGMELPWGRMDYYYDNDDFLIAERELAFNFSLFTLENTDSISYVNNSNGNNIEKTEFTWDEDLIEWVNSDRYFYTYDGNNNVTEEIYEFWGTLNSIDDWYPGGKYVSTYNGNDDLVTYYSYYWNSNTEEWDNSSYQAYTYTSFDKEEFVTTYLWDGNSSYYEVSKVSYFYLSDNSQDYTLYQDFDGSAYVNDEKHIYLYGAHPTAPNAPSNLTVAQLKTMDVSVKLDWDDNANNENGFTVWRSTDGETFDKITDLDSDTETFTDTELLEEATYYYIITAFNEEGDSDYSNSVEITTVTSINKIASKSNFNVYPNPATDKLTISSEQLEIGSTIKIYNNLGLIVKQLPTTNQIDIADLANGVYFIEISSTEGKILKKFSKE